MLAKLLSIGLKVAPKFKSWFFADGKFKLNRAITLLAFALFLSLIEYLMPGFGSSLLKQLDQVSDIIGYV